MHENVAKLSNNQYDVGKLKEKISSPKNQVKEEKKKK